MGSLRQSVENEIVARIIAAHGRNVAESEGYLRHVGTYNGPVDSSDDGIAALYDAFGGQTPAVLVSAVGGTVSPDSATRTRFTRTISIEIYVISNNLRSRGSRTQSDVVAAATPTADPGVFQIIEDLHDALAGQVSSTDRVGVFTPTREEPILRVAEFTIWQCTYSVQVDAHVNPRDYGTEEIEALLIRGCIADPDDETVIDAEPNPIASAYSVGEPPEEEP
jgi:hypothetical protein